MFSSWPQQADPQHLNLHRITFARRAGGIIRVHPGEMARDSRSARNPASMRMPLGVPLRIIFRDARQHVANGAAIVIHGRVKNFAAFDLHGTRFVVLANSQSPRKFLADDGKPQRRIRRVAVGGVVAVNGVRQRAVLFKFGEREQQFASPRPPCLRPAVRARRSASRGPNPKTTDNRR